MKKIPQNIIESIILDFKLWKRAEEELANSIDLEQSVIYTLARLNLSALEGSEINLKTIKQILNPFNELQKTASRMYRFVASCILKYGADIVDLYKELCYQVMQDVFGLTKKTIDELKSINECCWMCAMFTII